jgi:hypothetical protein
MALSTTTYGYIIDPLVPLTGTDGQTIRNGYVKVFVAGTSTPVITYANFDGTANQERIELNNSGRTMTGVIGLKSSLFKICVYDEEHSQENPILTVDKVQVNGASVTSTGAVTQGLNDVSGSGWVKASVTDNAASVELSPDDVENEYDTPAKIAEDAYNFYVPLVNKYGADPVKVSASILAPVLMFGNGATTPPAGADVYKAVSNGYDAVLCVGGSATTDKYYPRLAYYYASGLDRKMVFTSKGAGNDMTIVYTSSNGALTWTHQKIFSTP